ncbi:MAG: hypothetical protein HY840_15365 [Bacteroidetes bacterium]|nr:hypothetical protein [Bacteroidota bacterium]
MQYHTQKISGSIARREPAGSSSSGSGSEGFSFLQQTSDSGFVMSGNTSSFGTGGDVFLVKTNALGNPACASPNTLVTSPAPSTSSGGSSATGGLINTPSYFYISFAY